jgi:outer membrane lipoprotein-sorting protein
MVPDELRTALLAVTFGSLLVSSSVVAGAAAMSLEPTPEQPAQTSESPAVSQSPAPGDDDVVETFRDRMASLDTVVLTMESEVQTNGNQTRTAEQQFWVDYQNDRLRMERETNQSETITVRNESKTVIYNDAENTVSTYNNTGDVTARVPLDRTIDTSKLSYVGTERIDGERTYRLNVTPANASTMSDSRSVDATLWIDAETHFPRQIHIATDSENFEYETTSRFQNVTVNASIPDDRFTIDIPDDVERPSYESNMESYESLSALRNGTSQTVPEPDLPEDYSFEQARVFDGSDHHSITLQYETANNDTVTISTRGPTAVEYDDVERYDEVDVAGHTAYYTEFEFGGETTAVLTLPRDNATVSIVGDLSKSETIETAESLTDE